MNSKKWFKFISQNNEQSKKVLGFILLWMDLDDSVSQWVETQNDTIKRFCKLKQFQSFFSNELSSAYDRLRWSFVEKFSHISAAEKSNGKVSPVPANLR